MQFISGITTVRCLGISLIWTVVCSCVGCQVLRVPSYRISEPEKEFYECVGGEASCPPVMVPKLPGWLAKWHAKRHLPQPPESPRFQPLPTRPMFSPKNPEDSSFVSADTSSRAAYGHWPDAVDGGPSGTFAPEGPQPEEIGISVLQ